MYIFFFIISTRKLINIFIINFKNIKVLNIYENKKY